MVDSPAWKTESAIANVRAWWPDKTISTTEMGARLGTTKNAICGLSHRLELPARTKARPGRNSDWTPDEIALLRVLRYTFGWRDVSNQVGRSQQACAAKSRVLDVEDRLAALNNIPVACVTRPAWVPPPQSAAPIRRPPPVKPAPPPPIPAPIPRIVPRPVFTQPVRKVEPVVERYTGKSEPCCWPIGVPKTTTFRFCDDQSLPGKPYCTEHAKLAFVPRRDREDAGYAQHGGD
jgi:GcrA cell cycle regulator